MICKLNNILPCFVLLTMCPYFVYPHLENGDMTYDKPENESLSSLIESVLYKASLSITGAIRGASQEKL